MNTEKHPLENDVSAQIDAHEKALGDLLARLMNVPLEPVRRSVNELAPRLQEVHKAISDTQKDSLPALQGALKDLGEGIVRQMKGLKGSMDDRLTVMKAALDSIAKCQETLQTEVGRVDNRLADIASRMDAGVASQVAIQGAVHEVFGRVKGVGNALDEGLVQQRAQDQILNETVTRSAATLLNISQTLNVTSEAASKVVSGVARLHDDMDTAFSTTHATSEKLGHRVESLGQRMDGHQTSTSKQLAELQPDLTQQLDALAVMIKVSASQMMAVQEENSRARQAELATLVQEQLSLRTQPLRRAIGWLSVLCAASLLASLGLLVPTLMR